MRPVLFNRPTKPGRYGLADADRPRCAATASSRRQCRRYARDIVRGTPYCGWQALRARERIAAGESA